MSELVTQTEFARMKKCSRSAVTQAISSGRIEDAIREEDGKRLLDLGAALELWDKNTRRNNTSKPPRAVPKPAIASKQKKPTIIPPEVVYEVENLHKGQWPDLNKSRAKREACLARLAEIEVAEKEERLVPVEKVEKDWFSVCRAIRESFMNMPDRLSNQLAGETDATAIDKMLREEITSNLQQLAEAG
jgi:hypothetical protein